MTVAELIVELNNYPKQAVVRISNKFVEGGMEPNKVVYYPPDEGETPCVIITTYLCE